MCLLISTWVYVLQTEKALLQEKLGSFISMRKSDGRKVGLV
jgi:hypothetical protein